MGLNEVDVCWLLRIAMSFRVFVGLRKGVIAPTVASKLAETPLL